MAMYLARSVDVHIVGALRCLESGEDPQCNSGHQDCLKEVPYKGSTPPKRKAQHEPTTTMGAVKRQLERAQQEKLVQRLESKSIHGVHERETKMPGVNTIASHRWLVQGRLRAETEAMVIAAQCGVLETNAYRVEVQGKEGADYVD